MSAQWYRLARTLSDGDWHSGQLIAGDLGITRAAIWNHAHQLMERGVDLDRQRGKGYRLRAPLELLDREVITGLMPPGALGALRALSVHAEIDSTNRWLKQNGQAEPARGEACFAELQTAGRGRRGRDWHSPFASGIWLSLLWQFETGARILGGFSLAVAANVAKAVSKLAGENDAIRIKWPNDLMLADRKVGGILVDVEGDADDRCRAIIGIGINFGLPPRAPIDQPYSDFKSEGKAGLTRNEMAATMLTALIEACDVFERDGLDAFYDEFCARDWLRDQVIDCDGNPKCRGKACGIDDQGRLLIDTGDGIVPVLAGEVSVRRQ